MCLRKQNPEVAVSTVPSARTLQPRQPLFSPVLLGLHLPGSFRDVKYCSSSNRAFCVQLHYRSLRAGTVVDSGAVVTKIKAAINETAALEKIITGKH